MSALREICSSDIGAKYFFMLSSATKQQVTIIYDRNEKQILEFEGLLTATQILDIVGSYQAGFEKGRIKGQEKMRLRIENIIKLS